MQDMEFEATDLGKIQIADEVIQIIAGIAAAEVVGVVELSGGFAGGITESLLGRKNFSKGVRVQFGDAERTCTIELAVVLQFGVNIPAVSLAVQEHVKRTVESMTGLDVTAVNVHVAGIALHPERERGKETQELTAEKRAR
ncbi:Asp23/Gls24 family envelope stress response protein [Alicyclobacillus sp.]|uniref:Asp23/Gls24 family envelope stress response protein n=1 Tax=Alicyclobacillus sp. TaxID=61169 RepID=UPI0025C72979|nr:Asp23/Gls24 family envelope stress response protein [Alicyclobacillus sp.]MCL6516197.1 Asp23/Gls24 family envelope stress response protein [Alicyclobacillus sp.]